MKRLFYILLFVITFFFYWGTARFIENRTEAEDAYEYAMMVEQGRTHAWFYHPHHLLYAPSMKFIYSAFQKLGYTGRAFDVMIFVSALSAAGSLFFFFLFCYRRFSLRPVSSLIATGFLAVSYGYWRYAAEAEVVLPAAFLGLVSLYFGTDPDAKNRKVVIGILFSVLAGLVHIMNAVPVFLAIPAFYVLRRRWKAAVVHMVSCALLLFSTYWTFSHLGLLHRIGGGQFVGVGFGSFVKAAVALSQCVVSGDFVLGFRSVRAFLSELFAARMLAEEFYLGARLSRMLVLYSAFTFFLYLLLWLGGLFRAGWIWFNKVTHRDRFQLPGGVSILWVVALWFAGYAGLLLFIEPGNPELWVMGLLPFWLLFCGLILLPLTVDNRLWLPFLLLVVLFVHNGFGGIGLLGDPSKDYQHQKSKLILDHAGVDDVVVTAGNPVFERYLRYQFPGKVIYLYDLSEEELSNAVLPVNGQNIYILDDVFHQHRSLITRFPEKTEQIERFADKVIPLVEKVADDEFGGIYRLKAEG